MFAVMTPQEALVYPYLKVWYQADISMFQFWRPILFTILVNILVGVVLTVPVDRIPLKPIRGLIETISQLLEDNFHVRIHLDLIWEFVRLSGSSSSMAQELENTEFL